jgi:Cysteine-rich secretory protein family
VATAIVLATGVFVASAPAPVAADVPVDDWLGTVNTYRAMSGLDPVVENTTWSSQARAHSCYMLDNGISHDEIPGRPGYTSGGDTAGNNGNVAVSSSAAATARNHIDLWMTGPFHAIGILRHNLRTSGFGLCADTDTATNWHSGGTLDVIRGIDNSIPRPATPVLFPGEGSTVPLNRFVTEYPNPLSMCGWTGDAGLPLIAMFPSDVTSANSTLTGPHGPVETCTLHKGNVSDATARSILDGENAVVVMPRDVLVDGVYTATVNSNGGNVTWSFSIDRDAPLSATPKNAPSPTDQATDTSAVGDEVRFEPVAPYRLADSRIAQGTTRLQAGKVVEIDVTTPDVMAVSANFVAVGPDGYGFITAYNCTDQRPEVSTLNFRPGEFVANQAVVPLKNGKMCLYSLVSTDVVIDVNGFFHDDADSTFTPETPERLLDTRADGQRRLRAGEERVLQVAGTSGAAPADATGVSLNVTVEQPSSAGFVKVYPCGLPAGTEISTVNYAAGEIRPNSVVVPVDDRGRICIQSLVSTDVIVDYTGYFSDDDGLDFQPLDPIRMFDSRSTTRAFNESTDGARVDGGEVVRLQIAGTRGVPEDATAVSLNLTAAEPLAASFLTAYPCGKRPSTSTVNIFPVQGAAANGAMVKLSDDGGLCIYTLNPTHIIVDINGVYL